MPLFMKYVECISIEKESEEYTDLEISDDDEREILELSNDLNIHRRIRNSIAPVIFGAFEEKKLFPIYFLEGPLKLQKMEPRSEENLTFF